MYYKSLEHGNVFNRQFRLECLDELKEIFIKELEDKAIRQQLEADLKGIPIEKQDILDSKAFEYQN